MGQVFDRLLTATVSGLALLGVCTATMIASEPATKAPPSGFQLPTSWNLSAPLIAPENRPRDRCVSVKDPSLVFFEDQWHVFMTIRCDGYTPIEYCSFDKWENANRSPRHVLTVREKYFCAPQVFFFRPHKKWYLIYQVGEPEKRLKHHVGYSTTDKIGVPTSWTRTQLVFGDDDPRVEAGLDYWMICDDRRAYLFYTSLNGKMRRLWTRLEDFPKGFSHPELALQADVFEASHTYRLKGLDKYLTVIEAGQSGRRYYKAYQADRLDGVWCPLADSREKPFAGAANIRPAPGVELWTDNVSHGELVRDGCDETMAVDPGRLQFVFQGVLEKDKPKVYGKIPWRIGMLTPKP